MTCARPAAFAPVLSSVGGSFLGQISQGNIYIRLAPHEERVFSAGRLLSSILRLNPLEAFRNNFSQRQVMAEIRKKMQKYQDLRISVRNIQAFNLGGGNRDIDFVIRGPNLEALAEYGETLRKKAPELGLMDADSTLKLDKPELRVQIDRARAADLRVDTEDISAALRLMVGGDQEVTRYRDTGVNDDYDVQLRLTDGDRNDRDTISRLYVPSQSGNLVRLDNLVKIVKTTSPSRIDRLDRQRQVRLLASVAPGYAQADRRRRPPDRDRHEAGAGLLDGGGRTKQGAGESRHRVRLGVPAVRHLHVHDPGVTVREHGAPVHDSAVAAPRDSARSAVALSHVATRSTCIPRSACSCCSGW